MKPFTIKSAPIPVCKTDIQKEYVLYENGSYVMHGPYALLSWKRKEMVKAGALKYLLKIKPIQK